MRKQLIATMRRAYAGRYAANQSLLDAAALLRGVASAELIGAPGHTMRISVDAKDCDKLYERLRQNFVVQEDYALSTFQTSAKRPVAARAP